MIWRILYLDFYLSQMKYCGQVGHSTLGIIKPPKNVDFIRKSTRALLNVKWTSIALLYSNLTRCSWNWYAYPIKDTHYTPAAAVKTFSFHTTQMQLNTCPQKPRSELLFIVSFDTWDMLVYCSQHSIAMHFWVMAQSTDISVYMYVYIHT